MSHSLLSHRQHNQKHIHQNTARHNNWQAASLRQRHTSALRTSHRHYLWQQRIFKFACLFSNITGPSFLINKITFENFTLDYAQYEVSCCPIEWRALSAPSAKRHKLSERASVRVNGLAVYGWGCARVGLKGSTDMQIHLMCKLYIYV